MKTRKLESPIPFLPPANKVCEGYVFTRVCYSVHGRGGALPACIASGIPALQQVSRGVSQHALQVSRPTPRGKVEGDLAGGGLQAQNQGGSWGGSGQGGSPGPHPMGKLRGIWPGGSPGPHLGGLLPGGVCSQRGCLLQGGCGDTPLWWLLLWAVHILLECILVSNWYSCSVTIVLGVTSHPPAFQRSGEGKVASSYWK